MILYPVHNRQTEMFQKFFRENRENFFADSGINAKNYSSVFSAEKLSAEEKKKQKLEIRDTNREKNRIQKTLKKIKTPEQITGEIKEELDVFYSKNPELVSVILKEKFEKSEEIKAVLNSLKEDPAKEKQEVDTFFFEIKGKEKNPDSKQKTLLMKISPQKFLDVYIQDDKTKRKNYFRALSFLEPQKISTLTFVQKCNTEEFSRFLKELSPKEQKVFLEVFINTNKHHNSESLNISQLKNNQMKTNIISYARDESLQNLSISDKEEKMLAKVRVDLSLGSTGEKTANTIQSELEKNKNKTKNERERQKIFFRILREASSKYLQTLKNKGQQEILDAIEHSRKFYTGLFSLSNLSESQKRNDLYEIEKVYEMFTAFFSGRKNGDIARFYLENKGLTSDEVREIDAIENKKAEVEEKLLTLGTEYHTRISEIYQINPENISSESELQKLAQSYHLDVRVFKKSIGGRRDALHPSDFSDFSKELRGFGFSSLSKINSLIEEPFSVHHSIDKKVLIQWTKQEGISGFFRIASSRVIKFYSTSEYKKQSTMLTRFSHFEEVMSDDMTNKRKLSEISVSDELKAEFKEKTSPEYIENQLIKSQYEFEEIRLLLNKNGFKYSKKSFPIFSDADIKAQSQEFSKKLVSLMRENSQKKTPLSQSQIEEVILDELQNLGIDGKIEKLQNEKNAIKKHIEEGTLHPYIKGKGLEVGREGLSFITNTVSSLKNKKNSEEPEISRQEKYFLDFIEKFSPLSQKISAGKFKTDDLQNFLDIKNTNGETLVIPLSRTNKPIDTFEKETDSGIVFDPKSGHIIVSDDLYQNMQDFPEISHIRLLSHEVGHLWANNSNLEKNARKLLQQYNLLEEVEQEFLEIFPDKTGKANAVEEVFSELVAANQFGLENYTDPNFFQNTLGLKDGMSDLLKRVVSGLGVDTIQKIIAHSEQEFLNNAEVEKQKISVGKHGSGLSMTEEQKEKYDEKSSEDCEKYQVKKNDNDKKDLSGKIIPNIHRGYQVDAKIIEKNTNALFNDIEKYKSEMPEYSGEIDEFLERMRGFLAEDIIDLANNSITNDFGKKIMSHLGEINNKAREMSNELAQLISPDDNYLESLWANTQFLSMNDIKEMWTTAYEAIKRKLDTKAKKRRGAAGDSIFSGIWDGLANEFDKDVQNAEKTEVGEIQDALDNKQTDDVYAYLSKVTNEDEAKGALRVLSGRGMIDWDREEIYLALNNLGSGVEFYKSDFDNPLIRNSKYKKAFTRVWGEEEMFTDIFNENDGNIQSQIGKYENEASQNTGMKNVILQMIKERRKGEFVDPNRYEGYVSQMIGDGKGSPSEAFFYLIYGVAVGLIPIQAFNRIDKHQNIYSLSNFFSDKDYTRADAQGWVKEIMHKKGTEYRQAEDVNSGTIDHWLYKNAFTEQDVYERSVANLGSHQHDHDNQLLLGMGDAESGAGFLALGSTGDLKIKPTAYPNALVGMMENITSTAVQRDGFTKENLTKSLIRQAGYFSVFDGISSRKIDVKAKQKFAFSPSTYYEKPRMRGMYNGNMTVRDYTDAQKEIFTHVHTPAFQKILDYAFDGSRVGGYNGLNKGFKDLLKNDETGELKKALEYNNIAQMDDKTGLDFYQQIVPAMFQYFLSEDGVGTAEADANINSILAKANQVASGKCNPNWVNEKTKSLEMPNRGNIDQEVFSRDLKDIVAEK